MRKSFLRLDHDDLCSSNNSSETRIGKVDRVGGTFPLSFAQQRLWYLAHIKGISNAYRIQFGVRILGPLDSSALSRALNSILARHEMLRTTFPICGGDPIQQVTPVNDSHFLLTEHDLREDSNANLGLEHVVQIEASLPFNIELGPLVRGRLIHLTHEESVLLISAHHIAFDGWSIGILMRELGTLYCAFLRGGDNRLPELEIQYADYAVWQRHRINERVVQEQAAYWKATFHGSPALLALPTDHPRPAQQDYAGAFVDLSLDEHLTADLKSLSRRNKVTPFMTLLAGWALALARLSGQWDVVIGTPTANRRHLETEGLIGFFVNTLAIRLNMKESFTVSELLQYVKTKFLEVQFNQDIPFEQVVEVVKPLRSQAYSPLFQAMFAWQNATKETLSLRGATLAPLELSPRKVTEFDLTLSLQETGNTITGGIEYATSLFERASIERMVGTLRTILRSMVTDVALIGLLPMLSEAEHTQVIYDCNKTKAAFPEEKCVHELFESQVQQHPNEIAVEFGGSSLSYNALNCRANRFAHYLVKLGVKPDDRVALCVDRGLDMICALIAISKSGAAYIPLEPAQPTQRLRYMLEDAKPSVLLTHTHLEHLFAKLSNTPQIVSLDAAPFDASNEFAPNLSPQSLGLSSRNLAYIIYTSGSTGMPKGVMIEHRALVNLLTCMQSEVGITPTDVLLSVTTFAFDISLLELYLPLISGAKVIILSKEMAADGHKLAEEVSRSCTIMQATPITWRMLLEAGWRGRSGFKALCGGEAMSVNLANDLLSCSDNLWNVYGPTETTIWSTMYRVTRVLANVPIGQPIWNTRVYLLDANRNPVPVGVAGELYIGGAGVARGYLNKDGLTAEKFLKDPFDSDDFSRMYRTGDLGRRLSNRDIEYIGRNDTQVKIRGYRIELGEIEARLCEHPGIGEAVVIVREDAPGERRLIAYISECGDTKIEDMRVLRSLLSSHLPEYMIPSTFVRLKSLPMTANGKVDRNALPTPISSTYTREGIDDPVGVVEVKLAAVLAAALNLDRVGRYDNFFDLGGHSLLAIKIVASLNRIGVAITVADLFTYQTIEALAGKLLIQEKSAPSDDAVLIRSGTATAPVFFVHCGSGELLYLRALTPTLDSRLTIFGLPAKAPNREQFETIEDMAKRMVGLILATQQSGRYRVAGWCIGGVIAYETARQLLLSGRDVEFLGLIDSYYVPGMGALVSEHIAPFNENRLLLGWVWAETDRGPELQKTFETLYRDSEGISFTDLVIRCLEVGLIPERFHGLTVSEIYEWLSREHAFARASRTYTASEISSKVHLFAATLRGHNRLDLGWGAVVPKDHLVMKQIPGSHASIMRSPNVEILGEVISQVIQESPSIRKSEAKSI